MLLINDGDIREQMLKVDAGKPCFYCGKPLAAPIVQWMGCGTNRPLLLHPDCCVELTIRLLRDVHEGECLTGQYVTQSGAP